MDEINKKTSLLNISITIFFFFWCYTLASKSRASLFSLSAKPSADGVSGVVSEDFMVCNQLSTVLNGKVKK